MVVVVVVVVVVVRGRGGTSATVLDLRPPSAEKFGRLQGFPWLETFPLRWRKGRLGQPGSSSKPQPSGARVARRRRGDRQLRDSSKPSALQVVKEGRRHPCGQVRREPVPRPADPKEDQRSERCGGRYHDHSPCLPGYERKDGFSPRGGARLRESFAALPNGERKCFPPQCQPAGVRITWRE